MSVTLARRRGTSSCPPYLLPRGFADFWCDALGLGNLRIDGKSNPDQFGHLGGNAAAFHQ